MKNLSLNASLSTLFFAALFLLSSCTKEESLLKDDLNLNSEELVFTPNDVILSNDVSVNNGILHFNSIDDFRSTLLATNRLTNTERDHRESLLGFHSMQSIYQDIILAESIQPGKLNSTMYMEKLASGLIARDNISGLYELNIFNPSYAPLLNEDGLVMIGNDLYHFAATSLKIWNNANINEYELLLNTTESSGSIIVKSILKEDVILRNTAAWSSECQNLEGDSHMITSASFYSEISDAPHNSSVMVNYDVNVKIMIANANGEMEYDPHARFILLGESHTNFIITDGTDEFMRNIIEKVDHGGMGGDNHFIPNVNGQSTLPPPYTFVQSAHLMQSDWMASAKSSLGTEHYCELHLEI